MGRSFNAEKIVALRLILFYGEGRSGASDCAEEKKIVESQVNIRVKARPGPESGFNATMSTLRILSALPGRRPKRARGIVGSFGFDATSAAAISLCSPVTAERSP